MDFFKQISQLLKAQSSRALERIAFWEAQYWWVKYILVTLLTLYYTMWRGDYTLNKYLLIQKHQNTVQEKLEKVLPQFHADSIRLENIRTNPDAIEEIAREHYYMKSPGEEIYIIKTKKE